MSSEPHSILKKKKKNAGFVIPIRDGAEVQKWSKGVRVPVSPEW